MTRPSAALCFLAACAALAGCGRKDYTGDQRIPLSGKVTVDGAPMQYGVISFLPQDEKGRVSGGPIRDGAYSVPEEMGANAGKYRVEIHWNKPTGKQVPNPFDKEELIDELTEGLPDRFHKDSELTAEVAPEKTTFDFDLKSE